MSAASASALQLQRAPLQQRLILAGLLLAIVMVALLYQVISDNVAAAQNKRLASEQLARERHSCAMRASRLERDQCLASVSPSVEPVEAPRLDTMVAGR